MKPFVNTLGLYESRVHIEANESSHSSEHIVTLYREVESEFS